MSDNDLPPRFQPPGQIGLWLVAALVLLGLLAALPSAWALPDQAPDFQTVPTRTPTPTSPPSNPTNTPTRPSQPTATSPPSQPTATSPPSQPTATPPPTATSPPSQPTATSAPSQPTATATPGQPTPGVSPAAGAQALPGDCWVVPTPGFLSQPADGVNFQIDGGQFLVEPGQDVTLELVVGNLSDQVIRNLLLCAPFDPDLVVTNPTASRGRAKLEPQGLVVELDALAPEASARVSVDLGIPADYPLGGVIESQAWLFFNGQQASTDLWTWALPPAWLPPTGK